MAEKVIIGNCEKSEVITADPVSAEAIAAGLKFCCGKEERLTCEIAALRNVVQRAMIAGCKEAFDAWNYHFPDKSMELYLKVGAGETAVQGDMLLPANVELTGAEGVRVE